MATAGEGTSRTTTEEAKLPWARYVDEDLRPVVEWTLLGPLLVGDDGNIFVSCLNGKAYAIEVSLKPEWYQKCLEQAKDFSSRRIQQVHSPPADGGEEFAHWESPSSALHRAVVSCSARSQYGYPWDERLYGHALLRTNVGNERFDGIVPFLDHDAWMSTSIQLERLSNVSSHLSSEEGEEKVTYKAKEIRLESRPTDREATRYVIHPFHLPNQCFLGKTLTMCSSTYAAQMPLPLKNKLKISSGLLAVMYPVIWGASAGHVEFPNVLDVDMRAESEDKRRTRAKKTASHAKENKLKERSECSWEFDAWRDIFSTIRDNQLFSL